jgi:dihydroflavonol-4-reductase
VKALVTGGSGFIGSRLAAALAERGAEVRVLCRTGSRLEALAGLPVRVVVGDVLDGESLRRAAAGCDVVFHAAAISSYWRTTGAEVYRVNVDGTRNVLTACRAAGVSRVVYTSSVAAVGVPPEGTVATEECPFDAFSAGWPYADSKRRAEDEVRRAVAGGQWAVIVNPAAVVGAGDHNLISGSLIVESARRRIPACPPGGLCLADVDAVAEGHLRAAEEGRPGERYILGGENLTYREMTAIIARIAQRPPPRRTIPPWALEPFATAVDAYNRISGRTPTLNGIQVRQSGRHLYYDSGKAVRELAYPIMPFAGAAEKAYGWYRDHGFLA